MKVLLFANDAMPFGELPTSGGGLRCWQIYQGLRAHGIEVVASMPAFTYLVEKHYDAIPQEQRDLLWNWATQDEILRRTKPDAVIFASNWDHYGLAKIPDVPLIIDLHGSRLIETTMWNNPVDTDRKVEIFSKADCLLCAGRRQRNYFYGWLLQAGRVPEDEHFIRYIPVSLGPDQPPRNPITSENDQYPLIVSGGGWFPWQNQSKTIFAACSEIEKRNRGKIEIFGTPHNAGDSPEEDEIQAVYKRVSSIAEGNDRINVNGYISRNDLLGIYERASVALEAMEYNLERELAFTTRTVEYLWCGLPVMYNHFGELSEHISEYDAGWCVDPTSDSQIALALEEIFDDPAKVLAKSANAKRLVSDRFSWDQTIEPLVSFLNNPKKAELVSPVAGNVVSRAPFLNPGGTGVDVFITAEAPQAIQSCIIPAEGIGLIDVPLSVDSQGKPLGDSQIELVLRTVAGRTLCRSKTLLASIESSRSASLRIPFWKQLQGGQEVVVEVRLLGSVANGPQVILRGLIEQRYPFTSTVSEISNGRGPLGEEKVGSIGLRFGVATGKYYRYRKYFERAIEMIRRGEWRRLVRALKNRMPGAISRLLPV